MPKLERPDFKKSKDILTYFAKDQQEKPKLWEFIDFIKNEDLMKSSRNKYPFPISVEEIQKPVRRWDTHGNHKSN